MIYISESIVLASSSLELNAPWIGYHSIVTAANTSSDEAAEGFPVINLTNPSTHERWESETTDVQYITVANPGTVGCDYFGVARHNLGSTGAVIQLEASDNGVDWDPITEEISPSNDRAIAYHFELDDSPYLRLKVDPGTDPATIAVLYIGRLLTLPRRIYVGHTPMNYGRDVAVTTGKSESGQFLGRIKRRQFLKSSVDMHNITPVFYRESLDAFVEASAETPFFWAWRPSSYPEEVTYAWVQGAPQVTNERANGMMAIRWDMEGIS